MHTHREHIHLHSQAPQSAAKQEQTAIQAFSMCVIVTELATVFERQCNISQLSGDSAPVNLDLFLYEERMETKMKCLSKTYCFLKIIQTMV